MTDTVVVEGQHDVDHMEKQVEILSESFKGRVMVSIKEETWDKGEEELRWALVLKLLTGDQFNLQGLASVLKRAWGFQKGVTFMEIPGHMAVAKFDSENKMERVQRGGPWFFAGAMVLSQKWWLDCVPSNMEFHKARIWLQVHGLPLQLMNEEVAEGFAEVAGRVCQRMNRDGDVVKRRFIRFQVEVDVRESLSPGCYVSQRNKEPLWLSFKYERLGRICKGCGALNHEPPDCNNGDEGARFDLWLRADSPSLFNPDWKLKCHRTWRRNRYHRTTLHQGRTET